MQFPCSNLQDICNSINNLDLNKNHTQTCVHTKKKKKRTKQYSSAGTNLLDKSDTMVFSTLSPQIKSYQTWTTLSDIALLEQFCLSFHKLSFHVIWAFNWYFLSNLTIQYYPLYPMDFHRRCWELRTLEHELFPN